MGATLRPANVAVRRAPFDRTMRRSVPEYFDLSQIGHKHWEAFNAVLHVGSFTQAARLLRTSQPSISRLLKELQERLGFALFTRADGRSWPTAEALALHDEVERSFVGLERIAERAAQIKDQRVEQLRIVSMPALAHQFLPAALARFLKEHRGVAAALQVQRSETIASWVSTRQFDIGFAMLPMEKPGVEIELFDPAIGVCVMLPDHPLAARDVITPRDLHGLAFVGKGRDSFAHLPLQRALDDAGSMPDIRVDTPIAAVACELVANGVGVTITDRFTAGAFTSRGLIWRRFEPDVPYNFGVLFPSHSQRTNLVEAFMHFLRSESLNWRPA